MSKKKRAAPTKLKLKKQRVRKIDGGDLERAQGGWGAATQLWCVGSPPDADPVPDNTMTCDGGCGSIKPQWTNNHNQHLAARR